MTKKDYINIASVLQSQWRDAYLLDDEFSRVLQKAVNSSLEAFCRMLKENYSNFNEERFRKHVTG